MPGTCMTSEYIPESWYRLQYSSNQMHIIVVYINIKSTDTHYGNIAQLPLPPHTICTTTHMSHSFQEETPTRLGVLFLPDATAVLAPTPSLFFNDAPWLVEAGGARLVHPVIPLPLAEAMNTQSLRIHHQVIHMVVIPGFEEGRTLWRYTRGVRD